MGLLTPVRTHIVWSVRIYMSAGSAVRSEADVAVLRLAARVGQIRRGELGRGARGGGGVACRH